MELQLSSLLQIKYTLALHSSIAYMYTQFIIHPIRVASQEVARYYFLDSRLHYFFLVLTRNSYQVLVSIKNWKRDVDIRNASAAPPYKQLFGFTRLRQSRNLSPLYETISVYSDYRVEQWDDSQYKLHLRPLVSEQEWMQFKKYISLIYLRQNRKRAALRKLIEFNPYRSITYMNLALQSHTHLRLGSLFCRCGSDPFRDPYCICVKNIKIVLVLLPVVIISYFIGKALTIICIAVDVLTFPRFFFFNGRRHRAFLEAVMTAHPDLDPVLVEEELVQKLRLITDFMSRRHPGVYCRFTSILESSEKGGLHYFESFQIQFSKYVAEFQL